MCAVTEADRRIDGAPLLKASMLPTPLGNVSLLDDAAKGLSGNVIRPLACNKT